MSFAMPEVSWRRPNQLGDLMAVLELSAVDFDYCAPVPDQTLGRGLHEPRLTWAGRTEKEEIPDWPASRRQSREVSLISPHDMLNCLFLPYYATAKFLRQILCLPSG